jgi:hypothetical protein
VASDGISGSITGLTLVMSKTSRQRAIRSYRKRLRGRGISRFAVMATPADRDLIRSLAKHLAADSPEASRIRAVVRTAISGEPGRKGGILQNLRQSPLVGADLDLQRPLKPGHKVEL